MNDIELLSFIYYDQKNFVGVNELYKIAKERHPAIKKAFVSEWLSKQQTSQMNSKKIEKKEFLPIYTETPYSFQVDLTFLPKYKNKNDKYYVLFTAININTRFAYAYYARDKEMDTILNFIKQLEEKTIINSIACDKGTEFNNHEFKQFCIDNNINLEIFKADGHKLGIINRFHRTLKEKLQKYFDSSDNVRWIDILDKVIYNYNHTVNRGIGFKPAEVNEFKENLIREEKRALTAEIKGHDNTIYNIGDYCRVINEKEIFDKTQSKYSEKLFKIIKVNNNTLIIENVDDHQDQYKAKKNEIKIVKAPERVVRLIEKRRVEKEHRDELKQRRADVQIENVINGPRVRQRNRRYDD